MQKLVLALASLLACSTAFAQGAPKADSKSGADPQRFQQVKERYVQAIDRRIDSLQKMKGCVQGANDEQALRACRPQRGGEKGPRPDRK